MLSALLAVLTVAVLLGGVATVSSSMGLQTGRDRNTVPRRARAGQTGDRLVGVILVIVIAAAIGFIGTDVLGSLEDSITDTDLASTNAGDQTQFENATEEVSEGYLAAISLTDVVFIVLMFSVILGALLAFRVRGGGM